MNTSMSTARRTTVNAPAVANDGGIARAANDTRPTIEITTDLHLGVDAAIKVLATDRDIYARGADLVSVLPAADGGAPEIRAIALATMRERLTRVARWQRAAGVDKSGAPKFAPCVPGDHVASAVLARGQWPSLRPIVGILETPSMRPDGTLITKRGYDDATAYLLLPSAEIPAIPDAPTQEQARAALAILNDVFCDFPYRGEADRSVAVAAILSMIARPAIDGATPAFCFDATTPGSGKSLQQDVVSLIAYGRKTPLATWPKANRDEAELEKILGSVALRGSPSMCWDNVATAFEGASLDKFLTTSGHADVRVLGESKVTAVKWRTVMMASGNGFVAAGDTARRVLISRLQPLTENPEERVGFKHPNLRAWVMEERPRLVAAALTVLRAFVAANRPVLTKTWGSYEAWSALIPAAIVFAGGADPMECRPAADGDAHDEAKAAMKAIMKAIAMLVGQADGITARDIVDRLYTAERLKGQMSAKDMADGYDDARDGIESVTHCPSGRKPEASKLGYALRKWKRRIVEGKCIDLAAGTANGSAKWRVIG